MPASDPITGIADAISSIAGIAQPLLDQHLAQKYDDQYQEGLRKDLSFFDANGNVLDRDGLGSDTRQLLIDAEQPAIVGVSNVSIELPLQDFLELRAAVHSAVCLRQKANAVLDALTKK
jgi:hypothetical protein